jgi:hypothetical protein
MRTFQGQWTTLGFLALLTVAVIWYDVLAAQTWGLDATISRTIAWAFRRLPILYPLFWLWVGILIGHFGLPAE